MRNRNSDKISVVLVRHAATAGNRLRRYIGTTDEDIDGTDCLTGVYPPCDTVVSSPMRRCLQTARYLYPSVPIHISQELRECDFGDFENKSYEDLKDNPVYKSWLMSGGRAPFPNGEAHEDFKRRCAEGFFKALADCKGKTVAFVIHGGCIMAVMQTLFGGGFYDYQVKNGCGFKFEMEGGRAYDYSSVGGA